LAASQPGSIEDLPRIMTAAELPEDDDMLAGEYVLGTLSHAERAAATLRRAGDRSFDAAITAWEQRLAPLDEATPGVEPPAELWSAIQARIQPLDAGMAADNVIRFRRQLTLWKRATAISMALAAALALWIAVAPILNPRASQQNLIAILQKSNDAPAFVMRADLNNRALSVEPVSAAPVPGKSYELWIIDPELGPPRSLGLLGQSQPSTTKLPNVSPAILTRATYAVTIEPQGGAPNGSPTSAPVFFGHLLHPAS
jgi:anti-sigma-K factor RskA